jgi:hypothetical protein
MAEGDNLVDHPLDLKLLCPSRLRDLKDRTFFVFVNIFLPFWCMFYTDVFLNEK